MSPERILLTVRQAAERYALSEATLYEWSVVGKIPSIRLSARCLRFHAPTLDRLFAEAQRGATE